MTVLEGRWGERVGQGAALAVLLMSEVGASAQRYQGPSAQRFHLGGNLF